MGDNRDEYVFDEFDDGSASRVGDILTEKLYGFVCEYSAQLKEIHEGLEDPVVSVNELSDTAGGIKVVETPYEKTKVYHMVRTDNKLLNKVLIVFGALCEEMEKINGEAKRKYFPRLILFGADDDLNNIGREGDKADGTIEIEIANFFPTLIELAGFVNNVYAIVLNTVRQLAALYNSEQKLYVTSFKNIHLEHVFEKLGKVLSVLVSLDELTQGNSFFCESWKNYVRMVKTAAKDPPRFNISEGDLMQFEKMMFALKGQIVDGLIFQNCIEQEFECHGISDIRNNKVLKGEFVSVIRHLIQNAVEEIGTQNENDHRRDVFGIINLYVLYLAIFKDPSEKKLFRSLWDLHKIVPVIHLCGNYSLFLDEFLSRMVPLMVKSLGENDPSLKKDYLKTHRKEFMNKLGEFHWTASSWMVRMESNLSNRADLYDILGTRGDLMISGLRQANQLKYWFTSTVSLHLQFQAHLGVDEVHALFQCVELLVGIRNTFQRRMHHIAEYMGLMIVQLGSNIVQLLKPLQRQLEASKTLTDSKLDVLAACTLIQKILRTNLTPIRIIILKLAWSVVANQGLRDMESKRFHDIILQMENMINIQERIAEACDCSFLYWHREMLPAYFRDICSHPEDAQRLTYVMKALQDIIPLMNCAVHKKAEDFLNPYTKELESLLFDHIIEPIRRGIETDLRLHIHSFLKVSDRHPYKDGVTDFTRFLNVKPLLIADKLIDIKTQVTHYLETTFYNLNTVALYDWKTYEEMRNLARDKFGIVMTEAHLPGQTLEQGLDILEIMRNIHIFVSRYNYNLNNQIFIEKQADSKALNTINIQHVANSIRTHGVGIMNTTVNFAYQFLRQKFAIFSQFLFDEHIKSRLYKDIRYFRDNKDKLGLKYPFDRADKFKKEIRKLGVSEDGQTFLDKFRLLITEIGNAMGYIRMIRSGGLLHTSHAVKFIPDLQKVHIFEELVKNDKLSETTEDSARNVDTSIDNLLKNFEGGAEYFKLLVSVFANEMKSEHNQHLKNFYVIVPPLTLNFVEHILSNKEKLLRKSKLLQDSYTFTDDGLAIGVAFILRLLDQNNEFDTLHWFDSVSAYYVQQMKNVGTQSQKRTKEDMQTLSLSTGKIQSYQREFELLFFSFSGAKIFFDN